MLPAAIPPRHAPVQRGGLRGQRLDPPGRAQRDGSPVAGKLIQANGNRRRRNCPGDCEEPIDNGRRQVRIIVGDAQRNVQPRVWDDTRRRAQAIAYTSDEAAYAGGDAEREEQPVLDGRHQWKSCDLIGMRSSRRDGQLSGVRCFG